MVYRFYYDETEHSRKINLNTLKADNYYDNFITVIIGWDDKYEPLIEEKYLAFEYKYKDRKSKGELKSTTLSQKQFKNGFASMSDDNIAFVSDFLELFNEQVYWCFSSQSKVEFIIHQLFADYHNDLFLDADAVKYSIVKAINTYKPEKVMECIYENPEQLVAEIKIFLRDRIEKNKANIKLKENENIAYEQLLVILDDVEPLISENWDYHVPFDGFSKYLEEQEIVDYKLVIDREGSDQKTLKAAEHMGHAFVTEGDSKDCVGIRMADMMAGLLTKFMKAMNAALHSNYDTVSKVLLAQDWFKLDNTRKLLYKKFHYVISELNDSCDKSYAGLFTDDLLSFISLLEFIDANTTDQLKNSECPELFNRFCISNLQGRLEEVHHKLPREDISLDNEECFTNKWGAKVYADATKQPGLEIENGMRKCEVVNAGFDAKGIPTVTIYEDGKYNCYRIPEELSDWAMTLVAYKNRGQAILPANVRFSKQCGRWYADIL